ncbi:MAG: DUF6273 domain-containing protein [bacterium]|nr:DUF6273 domain-containing protein [bacterium]
MPDYDKAIKIKKYISGSGKKSALALIAVMICYFWYLFYIDHQFSNDAVPAEVNPSSQTKGFAIGSYVKFGNFPQDVREPPVPIDWLVLDNDGRTALLISEKGLECISFHRVFKPRTWKDCNLREWLNHEFAQTAFNDEELGRIADSLIRTDNNPDYDTKGCGETTDKIFCLSIDEAKKYFASDDARKCQPTNYALSHLAFKSSNGYCIFWLRSPGDHANSAACVLSSGAVDCRGRYADIKGCSVRPALRIIL